MTPDRTLPSENESITINRKTEIQLYMTCPASQQSAKLVMSQSAIQKNDGDKSDRPIAIPLANSTRQVPSEGHHLAEPGQCECLSWHCIILSDRQITPYRRGLCYRPVGRRCKRGQSCIHVGRNPAPMSEPKVTKNTDAVKTHI
jgi:hypothetical protein